MAGKWFWLITRTSSRNSSEVHDGAQVLR
uniref:Uncharacterized protein n=1 Tax=Arundo donax TaxID=35708 RepID=A0A0A9ES21_ARUDO